MANKEATNADVLQGTHDLMVLQTLAARQQARDAAGPVRPHDMDRADRALRSRPEKEAIP
jgi:hypothetical protein